MKSNSKSASPKKDDLLKQLRAIQKAEHKAMIDEWYPKFKAEYEGKFFKNRNSYGGGKKDWWLYIAVTEIKEDDVYDTGGNGVTAHYTGWQFQTDCYGNISIQKRDVGYLHGLEKEVTEDEFNTAYNKMIDDLTSISNT